MTGRRSHGRLSALNGVVHQGNVRPDAVKMSLSAKDWQPLGDAFEVHIRSPLKDDPSVNGEWREVDPEIRTAC